jgi:signal transduction histidine kinase
MGFLTFFWSLAAGISLTLAIVAGSVGMTERRNPASLTIFVLGLAVAVSAYLEIRLMQSATPAEYGEWLRWNHIPFFVAVLAQLLFIHYYLGTDRLWLMWTVIVVRLVLLIVNFLVHPNFNFSIINDVRRVSVLGEQITTIGSAVPRAGWQQLALVSVVLLVAYLSDAALQRWRRGGPGTKRRALTIGLGIATPWLATLTYNQLIIFGAIHAPMSNLPWFLGALLVMMFEMSRDYVVSRRALVTSAELQRQLLQIERAGVLEQLAAGLAHQLAQPLSANATNAVVAQKHLEGDAPDLKELREIVADIGSDSRRAAELITRMRQLIKHSAIEMQPVRIEDVVQDALVLVRPEATAKRVALSLLVQPNLPRVSGDRVHLSQVLINLLMNGIQAAQSCAAEARRVVVEAKADDRKGQVEVTVRDCGPGVPESVGSAIFEPFYTTKPGGMGIGLALSRTIVEAHGGRLWLDRTASPQGGSVFRFTLQRA